MCWQSSTQIVWWCQSYLRNCLNICMHIHLIYLFVHVTLGVWVELIKSWNIGERKGNKVGLNSFNLFFILEWVVNDTETTVFEWVHWLYVH
jgi:hypothetical protein